VLVTVLVEDDTLEQSVNSVQAMSLEQLAREMDEGTFIGTSVISASETIAPDQVEAELLAVGNDGTFFNNDFTFADGEKL
jgi:hypothetical protein